MQLTIDTSALVAVIANEPTRRYLVEVTRGAILVAPASVHWEVGNAFSAMIRRKRVQLAEVQKALTAYAKIPVRFVEVDLVDAMRLANRFQIYAYDAYVIACAESNRCPLLSLDRGLLRVAEKAGVAVVEVPT
jgi:predicted nucleic acid-binding protein